jgi:hypothetical protein
MADDSVQPVPWVLRVACRAASKPDRVAPVVQQVGTGVAGQMPALEQNGARPQPQQPLGLGGHGFGVAAGGSSSSTPASGRFGVIR